MLKGDGNSVTDSPWFITASAGPDVATGGNSEPPVRVYCFPHAGGNPRSFLSWQQDIGAGAQIVAVCPPSRAHRFREPAVASVAELADRAAEAIAGAEGPFLLFGHSFGALVAFEAARRLRGVPGLRRLVASGCSAPSLLPTRRVVETARLEGKAFTEAVGFFGGLPPEVVADEALADLLLPNLRADFRLVAGYEYVANAPLTVPVTLVNGVDDPHVKEAGLEPWTRDCAGGLDQCWFEGGHFYFEDDPGTVTGLLGSLVGVVCDDRTDTADHIEFI
ncbi:alpha/beta fold hydrolase [Streptomyces sp. B1866]|uniref:thioesterase II family protein n=1 Tax=Streptomyces sp. B1866 TaxID=3075431 RepID=UPI0028922DB9|nr:alpha/beta fold hydrolase [Streptomyces sp. B1866]MDT3395180.1 alpha/beta fold hydrolase [Streptomyces sp. B1866]